MTPRYTCSSYEGEPHDNDCPAIAEVRRQDAEFRVVFCEHDADIPCSSVGCPGSDLIGERATGGEQ